MLPGRQVYLMAEMLPGQQVYLMAEISMAAMLPGQQMYLTIGMQPEQWRYLLAEMSMARSRLRRALTKLIDRAHSKYLIVGVTEVPLGREERAQVNGEHGHEAQETKWRLMRRRKFFEE